MFRDEWKEKKLRKPFSFIWGGSSVNEAKDMVERKENCEGDEKENVENGFVEWKFD